MSVVINDHMYYRMVNVYRMVGINGNTLSRWLKEGVLSDVKYRDWRIWRLLE
jgi:predicted site-specific integrase-resolvase